MTAVARRRPPAEDSEQLLVEWGLWLSKSRSPMSGYRSTWSTDSPLPDPAIDDDTAAMLDRSVARLRSIHRQQGEALLMYFHGRLSYREIAARLGINRNQAQQLIRQAVSWIDGRLDAQRVNF
ncbi:antiterminator Q family protein [Alloalcanivorax xenomutans]|uniref:antiterminator Q family protein n=1 Tax=Alloalcanivorax xenomutans TaxID=1094342 RepID=UPI0006D835CC|nr:antiterminator Q family protein [Alloalcanivorax xenomutans]